MKRFPGINSVAVVCSSLIALTSALHLTATAATISGSGKRETKMLTLADRVAYQTAIEEVYWRHRIWPKENPGPKPSLDEVMSTAQIEKNVKADLRNSWRLADQWQRPITSEQLQAEMERLATHTKQPDVLRELFEALGNDPFVIAECLARPILAQRLCADLSVIRKHLNGRFTSAGTETVRRVSMVVTGRSENTAYSLPQVSVPTNCTNDTWTATSTTSAPTARYLHTAIWTGSEMIVWGGVFSGNTGGRYNPTTDSWTATSTTNAPSGRDGHSAIWTGSEMIIWGGVNSNTGGRYNPSTNSWTATNISNAPAPRTSHTAVWTGTEMIVWGGYINQIKLNSGGRYNPGTDTWVATSTTNAPAGRDSHAAVWTGSEMIVWGGRAGGNTGGRYNPMADTWAATSLTNAPEPRYPVTSVWTGSEMIVWGGLGDNGFVVDTGGRYNPSTDNWAATSNSNAPVPRHLHTAVWTGSEMIIWGGTDNNMEPFNTGARYNPDTDFWTITSTTNAPAARNSHTAVWAGSEMIVWGGQATNFIEVNTGGRYCAPPSVPIAQSAVSQKMHGSAGTFDVDLPLTGTPGVECRSGAATNDFTMVVTFAGNVTVTGSPQAQVTSGSGTIGSGGVSNGGMVTVAGNIVTIPLTNVADQQTINVTLNGVNSVSIDQPTVNVVIPMSRLLGDTTGNRSVNSGDILQVKQRVGQTVSAANFRSDLNANGSINAGDVSIAKQNTGHAVP